MGNGILKSHGIVYTVVVMFIVKADSLLGDRRCSASTSPGSTLVPAERVLGARFSVG